MSAGKDFMFYSQYSQMGPYDQAQGVPQPPLQLPCDPAAPQISLPDPASLAVDPVNLRDLIERRATVRRYADTPISLAELSYLLWCTQGVKPNSPPDRTRRTVPSAGARHAFETYVLANRVEGVQPGLYRFVAIGHTLTPLNLDADITSRIKQACLEQEQIPGSAITLIWVAVPERMTWRYGERGYRYLHLDAGHVCQNLYLAALSIGCGICPIGAFDDEALNHTLDLDGETLFAIYLGTVGKLP